MEYFDQFPILSTGRLVLRQMTLEDAADLYHIYSDKQVIKYLDWNGPSDVEQARALILSWNELFMDKKLLPWGITRQSDPKLIGTIMYMPSRGTFETIPLFPLSIGFELSTEYWNQGIMSEALEEVTQFGIHTIGAHRIQADVVPENTASLRILKKFGFKYEGLLKQYLKHDVTSIFIDVVILALISN
ncbi:N-acetyltransferase [Paenibacillus baekrokdamisoli]|uniref:N-acetyltransferase n=1 Tax=Paenibacillus baekrokdamisoli TaxID=1712516 RepID=A0A3G9JKH6_9BACL|nr:GNAT family N-acetyltransferase [Paenibacillus baekrokdamisoli]MBB3068728.1 ribosomal-protein-alanine N-acetyltransferase [Paenibacillus baekrokdamisoli]BBH23559.1 N-acetyltransferase [Paenibacillus baekrokdamisoli]